MCVCNVVSKHNFLGGRGGGGDTNVPDTIIPTYSLYILQLVW